MTQFFESPPGATPIQDCSGLKLPWVITQEELNRAETENISRAHTKYLSKFIQSPLKWFNPKVLVKIHQEMFGNIWEWAGIYRKATTNIGSSPYMIPSMLADLCKEVHFWSLNPVELTFLEKAARIHHRLVSIHPFENGNGRFSRLVADRYLLFWGGTHPVWPTDLQKDGSARRKYLESLKSADKGDYDPMILLMKRLEAKDPPLSELLGSSYYTKKLTALQKLAIVKAFLRLGYQVDEPEKDLHPLHIAIKKNYDEIGLLLIEHMEDFKSKDRSGYDAFELAISMGNTKIANALRARINQL